MKPKLDWTLTPSLIFLTALACDTTPEQAHADVEPPPTTLRSSALYEAACPADRQVARTQVPVVTCPVVPGWQGTRMFDTASANELATYCIYRWSDPNSIPSQTQVDNSLGEDDQIVDYAADCEVVFEQADLLTDELAPLVQDMFRWSIGWVSPTDLNLASTEDDRSSVMVAVVDTVPEPAPVHPRSRHGEVMTRLIDDIACPDPSAATCAVDVVRVLGMPRYQGGLVDLTRGGQYGGQTDLSKAIYGAVREWETSDYEHMVMNLSLGWEPDPFGGEELDLSPPVASVHVALEYAACRGVLVVVAAGNESHLCTDGALEPASWEQHLAPTAARCAELGIYNPDLGTAAYQPLVHAVGGLRLDNNLPMVGTRSESFPRLGATATHAVSGSAQLSPPVTGTSVASAVGAGVASLVWSYNPDLHAHDLMDLIYGAGQGLPHWADLSIPGTPNTLVRKINACESLYDACDRAVASCPSSFVMGCLTAPASTTMADVFTAVDLLPATPELVDFPTPAQTCPGECGTPREALLSGYAATQNTPQCRENVDLLVPYTTPQPIQPVCPNCTLNTSNGMLNASLDPYYADYSINDVTVSVYDGTTQTDYRLGPIDIKVNFMNEYELDSSLPVPIQEATIYVSFDELPRAASNTLLIQ